MKNKLTDLNDHLFAQLERLNDETTQGEELKREIERTAAISAIAKTIIENGRLVLDAHRAADPDRIVSKPIPMLTGPDHR